MLKNQKKYTDQQVQELIQPFGLLLDQYVDCKNIYAHDKTGYKYHFTLSNIRLNRIPHWIMKNPFALENVRLYLSIHYPDYELLDDEYHSCKEKMHFICHRHEDKGIQLNSIDNIVNNNHACKYCGYCNGGQKKMLAKHQLIQLCESKHILYHDRYLENHQTIIQYRCPHHKNNGIQEMTLDHLRSSVVPCKYCQITSGEYQIKQFLDKNHIPYFFQHTFADCKYQRKLEFDFYLPTQNTVIEYDGKQHFQMMKYGKSEEENLSRFKLNQLRDEIKNQYCDMHHINLIRIPYWDYAHIDELLTHQLLHETSA